MKKIFTFISACVVCMSANAQLWTVGENLGADKWATYNVGGQQVDAAYKGIVIVGGKKMVK